MSETLSLNTSVLIVVSAIIFLGSLRQLRELQLNHLALTGTLPKSLGSLKRVKLLYVGGD